MSDTWRDAEGFGRPEEVGHGTYSVKGPDDEDHAVACDFIKHEGILPCSCDATRRRFGVDEHGERTYWYQRWLRWQKARVKRYHSTSARDRVPWPVTGPDGEPWIAGIDFNDN